jgi:hypothetical protein
MPKKKNCRTAEEDRAAFIAAAHELECDESPEAFEKVIKAITKAKPTKNAKMKKRRKKK